MSRLIATHRGRGRVGLEVFTRWGSAHVFVHRRNPGGFIARAGMLIAGPLTAVWRPA